RKATRLLGQTSAITAGWERHRKGKPLVAADPKRGFAENFLRMMHGSPQHEIANRVFDECLVLHADHEFNASTFAARVIAATLSDVHSAVVGAIGALKGPLHGGANEQVMRMLFDIEKKKQDPIEYVKDMLANKKKVPGMGHRVYKTEDPRATHLRRMSQELGKEKGNSKYYEWSAKIEDYMKREKKLNANVDFYSASVYTMLGLDVD